MIAPGVPDMHSMRTALEMGYEVHEDGLWWPEYDMKLHHEADWPKGCTWPAYIHNQWKRLGRKLYSSPDGLQTKLTSN
jgi:hypothetical protein